MLVGRLTLSGAILWKIEDYRGFCRISNEWEDNLGIEASYEAQSWEDLLANRSNLNYSVARAGWGADYNDPASFLEIFASWSPDNQTGWSNSTYDGYIKQARQTLDSAKRIQQPA